MLEVCTRPAIWSTPWAPGEAGYCFRFDPDVRGRIAESVSELTRGLEIRSPWGDGRQRIQWSSDQHASFVKRVVQKKLVPAGEVDYLSPYQFPLPAGTMPDYVQELVGEGYVSIIELALDGGGDEIRRQLDGLTIQVDDKKRSIERMVEELPDHGSASMRARRVLVGEGSETFQFLLWSRQIGGDDGPRAEDVVANLPGRWPELRRVELGVAVEESETPLTGVFVIFLPTTLRTGGASCPTSSRAPHCGASPYRTGV